MQQPDFSKTEKVLKRQQILQQRQQAQQMPQRPFRRVEERVEVRRVSFGLILKWIIILGLIILGIYLFSNPEKVMGFVNNFFSQFGV